MRNVRRSTALLGLTALTALAVVPTAAQAVVAKPSAVKISKYISGLNAPRGIAFDARQRLYVAESGTAGNGPAGLTKTGKVTRYARNSTKAVWSKSLESVYASEDPSQPPDVLGPEGLSAVTTGCTPEWHSGCGVRLIVSESHDGVAAMSNGAISTKQIGHLYRLNKKNGHLTDLSNVGDQMYAWTNARKNLFPDDFPDSNPYGVLVYRDAKGGVRTFVADAGANTISEVKDNGKLRVVAYIPNETAAPNRDSTPTCMALGPDGKLYVATLHLLANFAAPNGGKSDVWRVNPDAKYPTKAKVWTSGLTSPTACTFDRDGNFWATEMFQPNPAGPPGDVVRIPFKHPHQLKRIGLGKLPLPGGIVQGPGGAMFVTVNSANPTPGSGAVMKVTMP